MLPDAPLPRSRRSDGLSTQGAHLRDGPSTDRGHAEVCRRPRIPSPLYTVGEELPPDAFGAGQDSER